LPSDAYLTVDRRLLPGDDPRRVPDEIRATIGELSPWSVEVEGDVYMLPALVAADHPGLLALQAANRAVRGAEAGIHYGLGTFDAGGPCALGVPSVMYGASGGEFPTGADFVPISAVETEAKVLAHLILDQLA
jgi:acetylornithine deacetylase/succinyl-diaminopimelate desuccinylase-like protein